MTWPEEIGPTSESAFSALQQRVGHTEDRLAEIKTELRDLNTSVKELNATIAAMGKPNFQMWGVFGTLICTISAGAWFLAITPINQRIQGMETAQSVIVPREVHIEKWAQADKEIQRLQNEIAGKASKDDLNRMAFDLIQKIGKKK